MKQTTIGFIGAGNMASSLIQGLLSDGHPAENLRVADPISDQLQRLAPLGIGTSTDNNLAISGADVIVLAVKPQVAGEVVSGLSELNEGQLLISIAAGINLTSLQTWTHPDQPIVRCMPNTPALVGKGATGLFANAHCSSDQRRTATDILDAVGNTVWVEEERELDAVTAVSGSGPAYFFLLMEAMIDAGVALGLDRETATQLTLQTAAGAAAMAQDGDDAPSVLRQNVTSPGGTTEAALNAMYDAGLPDIIARALSAADTRAAELAEEFGR